VGYSIILPAHLSISFSNDYFDVEVDKFGIPALFSGGSGILVEHPKLRRLALGIAKGLILCSILLGIFFLFIYSYPIWFLGYVALGNLLGWFYSAPPLRLASRGWGELLTSFIAGCFVPGLGFLVMQGYITRDGLLFTVPLMLYGLAFILSVEIPDEEADRLGQKNTWVVRKGRAFSFTVIGSLLIGATVYFFYVPLFIPSTLPLNFRLLGYFSLFPLGTGVFGMVKRPVERQMATKLVNGIIASLAVFFFLTDVYLVFAMTN
jgi:1,4-dihydroxy-2-naphthoate octaprenyltransferase